VTTDESCLKTKEVQGDVNDCTSEQKSDAVSLLLLDTLNMNYTDLNSDRWVGVSNRASNSNESQFRDNDNNLPKSPVLSRSQLRLNCTSAKKFLQLSKTIERNKETSDVRIHHNAETISQKHGNKLDISTTYH